MVIFRKLNFVFLYLDIEVRSLRYRLGLYKNRSEGLSRVLK